MSINLIEIMSTDYQKELIKEISSKFMCPSRFAQEIEKVVNDNGDMSYIDAIVYFCEENKIDFESVPKLISKPLKEKIKCEAINLNFLKKTSRARLKF
jgi:hypothetical protein